MPESPRRGVTQKLRKMLEGPSCSSSSSFSSPGVRHVSEDAVQMTPASSAFCLQPRDRPWVTAAQLSLLPKS